MTSFGAEDWVAERDAQKKRVIELLLCMEPIKGTRAESYLKARGLDLGPWCKNFGFIEELPYLAEDDRCAPAMLAPIVAAGGEIVGLLPTWLDAPLPAEPIGRLDGALIPLGEIGETLAVGVGVESARAWYLCGLGGGDDVTLAAAGTIRNMAGACTGSVPHPTLINPGSGKPYRIPNGIPDLKKPGMILPPQVKRLFLIGEGGEPVSTRAHLLAAARRYRAHGLEVFVQVAPSGKTFLGLLHESVEVAA